MDIATFVGHLAFGLIAFSYLVKDIMYLRILSIVASLFGMFFNYTVPAEPLWLPIGWNAIFVMVNIYHISVLLYEKRPVQMDDKNTELYNTLFKDLTPVEYLKISKAACWKTYESGDVLIRQLHLVPDLILIYNGTVEVEVDGNKVAELRDGQFVGEMSFLTEKSATATCIVKHPTECLVWKQQEFKDLLKRNPSLYFTIQSLLSAQVSSNLVSSSKNN
tara:strand:+ start:395 stop:1051 length:657 start_codon:yes stop_codon:yes gene_type:complete